MHRKEHRVALERIEPSLSEAIRRVWDQTGLLTRINGSTRVALKPNFTYPYYKRAVTASPSVIREAVKILRERTTHSAIVETDGRYGAWRVTEACAGHGIYDSVREFGGRRSEVRDQSPVVCCQ